MLGLDAAGKTSAYAHLFFEVRLFLRRTCSYLVQAQTEPVRHDDPHWCVSLTVHTKLELTLAFD